MFLLFTLYLQLNSRNWFRGTYFYFIQYNHTEDDEGLLLYQYSSWFHTLIQYILTSWTYLVECRVDPEEPCNNREPLYTFDDLDTYEEPYSNYEPFANNRVCDL